MDYYTINKLINHIKEKIINSKIKSVYEDKYILSLKLNKGDEHFWLNFATHPETPGIFVSEEQLVSEKSKRFEIIKGAKIEQIELIKGERILVLQIVKKNIIEKIIKFLSFSIMGKVITVSLINEMPQPIIDNRKYIWDATKEEIAEYILKNSLSDLNKGFFPVPNFMKEEIEFRIKNEKLNSPDDIITLWKILDGIKKELFSSTIFIYKDRIYPLNKYLSSDKSNEINETIKSYIIKRLKEIILSKEKSKLKKVIKREIKKLKKLEKQIKAEVKELNPEIYKLWAETILINLSKLGDIAKTDKITLKNPYNDKETVTISVKPYEKFTKIVQELFKKHSKAKKQMLYMTNKLKDIKYELIFLEELLWFIEKAEDKEELDYIKSLIQEDKELKQKHKEITSRPYIKYKLDNIEIIVGKNARGNDIVTFNIARREDTWFHVKNIPGAHVIAKSKDPLTEDQIKKIASIAAFHSKAKDLSKVEVDYTKVKFVKRLNRKKGMVLYTKYSTVLVKPYLAEDVHEIKD